MAKNRTYESGPGEAVISLIGPGMRVIGNLETDGTVRIEGMVEGNVRAGKGVVVGKGGYVSGDIQTQDAVVAGNVTGVLTAESRLELQSTSQVEGEIIARRMQLDEGAMLNGTVQMVDGALPAPPPFESVESETGTLAPDTEEMVEQAELEEF